MRSTPPGFTLIEVTIVVALLGLLLAAGVPAFRKITQSYELRGEAETLAGVLRLARQKAVDTGVGQTCCFLNNASGVDFYHQHNGTVVGPLQRLPKDLSFTTPAGVWYQVIWNKDGTVTTSKMLTLKNSHDLRDTVSVQTSGMVLVVH